MQVPYREQIITSHKQKLWEFTTQDPYFVSEIGCLTESLIVHANVISGSAPTANALHL